MLGSSAWFPLRLTPALHPLPVSCPWFSPTADWQKAAAHLRKSLAVVEARYGASSIEMGRELFKLAQILFNG